MKKRIQDKLFSFIELLKCKIREEDFDIKTYTWNKESLIRFEGVGKSWRNLCYKYRKKFDSREDYLLDLNLFDFELTVTETELILKHQYGAELERGEIFKYVVNTRENSSEIAIQIINSLNYKII